MRSPLDLSTLVLVGLAVVLITMIDDGIKGKGMEEKVQALDVMELVAENMR